MGHNCFRNVQMFLCHMLGDFFPMRFDELSKKLNKFKKLKLFERHKKDLIS